MYINKLAGYIETLPPVVSFYKNLSNFGNNMGYHDICVTSNLATSQKLVTQ